MVAASAVADAEYLILCQKRTSDVTEAALVHLTSLRRLAELRPYETEVTVSRAGATARWRCYRPRSTNRLLLMSTWPARRVDRPSHYSPVGASRRVLGVLGVLALLALLALVATRDHCRTLRAAPTRSRRNEQYDGHARRPAASSPSGSLHEYLRGGVFPTLAGSAVWPA